MILRTWCCFSVIFVNAFGLSIWGHFRHSWFLLILSKSKNVMWMDVVSPCYTRYVFHSFWTHHRRLQARNGPRTQGIPAALFRGPMDPYCLCIWQPATWMFASAVWCRLMFAFVFYVSSCFFKCLCFCGSSFVLWCHFLFLRVFCVFRFVFRMFCLFSLRPRLLFLLVGSLQFLIAPYSWAAAVMKLRRSIKAAKRGSFLRSFLFVVSQVFSKVS